MAWQLENAVKTGRLRPETAANVERWLTEPQYARYAERIRGLLDAGEFDALEDAFWQVIPFGTGGRRGPVGELGSATINERTIAESALGLAAYLTSTVPVGAARGNGSAVVAYDTRLRSEEFARLTATVLAAGGLSVFLFESPRSTPELSFAIRHLGCDAGVVISASHNPPEFNGFKAYWSAGEQILPPHDAGIIRCVESAGLLPPLDFESAVSSGSIALIGDEVDRAYLRSVVSLSLSGERGVRALYTPLHGVGTTSVSRVLEDAGFEGLAIYEPQRAMDGNFSNVPDHYPNPERPAVFEPAIEHAQREGMDLVLASDPDADRLGVSARSASGHFEFLHGNALGALLASYVIGKRARQGSLSPRHYVVETLVTTPLIASIARKHGIRVIDTLPVGFKFIAQTIEAEGADGFVFGAEESLGYLAGDYCRDKDASIAALYVMELAAELGRDGRTLLDELDALHVEHGYHLEDQWSLVCEGASGSEDIRRIMADLRESPPASLGGCRLTRVRDYSNQEIHSLPENERIGTLEGQRTNILFFDSEERPRISIAARPSGTEPKIKFYFFIRAEPDAGPLEEVRVQVTTQMAALRESIAKHVERILAG